MTKRRTSAILSGLLSLAAVMPALGQADADERLRELKEQQDRAIEELFRDLQLQELADDQLDPRERIEEHRRRFEEIQRRVIDIQLEHPRQRLQQQRRAAEPMQFEREMVVSPWLDHSRDEVVAGLNHAEYAVRESAEAFLLTDDTLSKDVIKQLIKEAATPEQRQRLLRVAEHHVMRELRERDFGEQGNGAPAELDGQPVPLFVPDRPASVGYSYEPVLAYENPQADLPGVRVNATMPGFPGHAHLRRGDIVIQINGISPSPNDPEHRITSWVQDQIELHEAGDTIDFTLLRDGRVLGVKMACAQGKALDHMYATNASSDATRKEPYKRAWRDARAVLVAEMPKPKTLTPVVHDAE